KRKYGNFILSKSFESQKKELIFRLIAYNVDRKLILSVWVLGFHQSQKTKTLIKSNLLSIPWASKSHKSSQKKK
ncbi:MAG: hypothetical protein V1888_01930, partial [archaeon]